VLDEPQFRILLVLVVFCFVLFFSVSLVKIVNYEQKRTRWSKTNHQWEKPDSYWYETAGGFIHSVFHNSWFGLFRHYEPQLTDTNDDLWYVGVLLALIGTVVAAIGNHCVTLSAKLDRQEKQKYDFTDSSSVDLNQILRAIHSEEERSEIIKKISMPSFIVWVFGNVAITILGTALTLGSYAFASQALLAPLSGLTIVWNAFLSTTQWFGNATLSRNEILATFITLSGCVFIVFSGPRESKHYTLAILMELFLRIKFLIFVSFSTGIVIVLRRLAVSNTLPAQSKQFLAGMLPGFLGGFSNLFAKASVELLASGSLLSSFTSLLVFFTTLGTAFHQLQWINDALAAYTPLVIVPVYQASLLLTSTVCGAVFYGDFDNLGFLQYATFAVGVVAIIGGVVMLARGHSASESGNQEGNKKFASSSNVGVHEAV